mmetsp:Transcript_1018/g.1275  ORF Transcript_1018/g.1275 Transcript_1018/m.1275 type:complete len:471 (+) Transcript_1018:185-1597(+)|eukprot:CAMPEP_0194148994 /NCGR_PEP_ID=MMETSP0152-20130528/35798_1 /TAXON_ID=1049557 /ORGANISM="Thalassiothrix antarctica, Strain L6-D1" /LENGTH=470 /DNA_ID=CAMNT_0038850911 /DNA_START=51 /DNA_END=1463 /DNA_ORIENTATION=-
MVFVDEMKFVFQRESSTRKIGDPQTQEVSELTYQGDAVFSSGNHKKGIELIRKALKISEKDKLDLSKVADLLTIIGDMEIEARIDNGFKQHTRALEIRSNIQPNTEAEAESQDSVGMILLSYNQSSKALKYLEMALRFHKFQNPLSIKTAVQYTHVGQAQRSLGRLNDAYESFKSSLLILKNINDAKNEAANVHFLLGSLLREQGAHPEAAETHLNQAISLFSVNELSLIQISNCYLEIGRVKCVEGSSRKGLLYYGKALEIQSKVAPTSLDHANTLHQLGLFYMKLGQPSFSKKYIQHAVLIRETCAPSSLVLAESLYYLGEVLTNQEELSSSMECHKRALQLRSQLKPLSIDEAESFHAVGHLAEKMGHWQEALYYYSMEFIARDTDAIETAKVHNIIGNILLRETNRINDSVSNHEMAVAIQSSHGKSSLLAKYLEDLISAVRRKGDNSNKYEQQLQEIIRKPIEQS